MATSVSAGVPCWVDDPTMSAQTPFRTYDVGTRVYNAGTASANQVPGGVFPGLGAMGVAAPGGMAVTVQAGYCCVPNSSSSTQGGYIFGLMASQSLTIAASDPVNPRIDLVVAYVSDLGTSASAAYVAVVTGTASASPSAPSAPSNSITLAQVRVAGAITSIASAAITDERSYVVAPGGILPVQNAAAAPAVPASQFMYNLATGQLVQGTGSAGSVALPVLLPWVPQIAVKTTNTLAASGGALTTVQSVSVTTDGSTDIEMYAKWTGVQGSAGYIAIGLYIDGTLAGSVNVQSLEGTSFATSGGSVHIFTSAAQSNTPSAATHTVALKFQAAGGGTTTSDGIVATSSSPCVLRVAPVST